jgi:hypothetical protein
MNVYVHKPILRLITQFWIDYLLNRGQLVVNILIYLPIHIYEDFILMYVCTYDVLYLGMMFCTSV